MNIPVTERDASVRSRHHRARVRSRQSIREALRRAAGGGGGPGEGGGGGGGAPPPGSPPAPPIDWNALIHNDPAYQAWEASRVAREGNLATERASAIRQLILGFGAVPGGMKDAFGDLRPEDIAAAAGNQFSTEKLIERGYDQARHGLHGNLASRGMLQSGELNYGENQATMARGQAEQEATMALLSQIAGASSGYTHGVGDIQGEESGLIAQILPRLQELYGGAGGAGAGGGAGGGAGSGGTAPPPTGGYLEHPGVRMVPRTTLPRMSRRRARGRRAGQRPPRGI